MPAPGSGSAPATGKKNNYALNSGDKLFSQLCDLNFAVVGGLLNKIAKRINENYEVKSRFAMFDLRNVLNANYNSRRGTKLKPWRRFVHLLENYLTSNKSINP
jgi:hypothetical protein